MAKENILLVLILPLLSTRLLLPLYVNWQAQKKLLIKNFEGKQIATAGGTIIFLALLFIYPFCNQMSLPLYFNCSWLFFYLLGIAILGAIDDFYGEKDCKDYMDILASSGDRKEFLQVFIRRRAFCWDILLLQK